MLVFVKINAKIFYVHVFTLKMKCVLKVFVVINVFHLSLISWEKLRGVFANQANV